MPNSSYIHRLLGRFIDHPPHSELFPAQVKLIYANALPSTVSILVISLLAWSGFRDALPETILNGWVSYMLCVAALRLSLFFAYRKFFDESRILLWATLIIASAASAGFGWAGVGLFAYLATDFSYKVIIVMIVLGIMAATVPVLSALLPAFYIAGLPPAIVLFAVIWQWEISGTGILLSALTIYTGLVIYTAKNTNGILLQTLRLQRERETFIGALNAEVEERRKAQRELEEHQQNLEILIRERTHQLTVSNVNLEREVTERMRSEEELREKKKHLEHIAFHDALTNLPNRVLLADRLKQSMVQAKRVGHQIAVAYLDLDGFKKINDEHGHQIGDQFLIALGRRLGEALRETDTIGRLGGDEFVALLIGLNSQDDSIPLLNRILATAAQPVHVGELLLQVSASIGVTSYPQSVEVDADQLLRQADQAMYQAKVMGKNRYYLFEPEKDRHLRGQHESIERINLGLVDNEFELHYQPIVNMRTGEVIGVEALIRWRHPQRGLLLPNAFLPLIESESLAVDIDIWVVRTALNQLDTWKANGMDLKVSVNVGARFLQQVDFVSQLTAELSKHPSLEPADLKLEVLETSALEDLVQVSQVIRSCNDMGVDFALDDFGTGYSSLTYLKLLPAAYLKIDRSFVRDMLEDTEDLAILEGVLGLAAAFRRVAIAEGVETSKHGEILLQLGCELAQGYAIAKPMPPQDLPDWVSTWRPDSTWLRQRTLSREDLALLFASIDHRTWVKGVDECMRNKENGIELNAEHCRFGHWLNGSGKTRYSGAPNFKTIVELHHKVHQIAARLCRPTTDSDKFDQEANRDTLYFLRDRLLSELDLLHQSKAELQS